MTEITEIIYVNQEQQHNKMWSYEINKLSVLIKWGRVGLSPQSQTKTFSNSYERDNFIQKKISEKEAKGYQKVSADKLAKEQETAQAIGWQYKINNINWTVRIGDGRFQVTKECESNAYALVEILQSWSKEKQYIILNKQEAYRINNGVYFNHESKPIDAVEISNDSFVQGIRAAIFDMFEKVAKAIVKFASVAAIGNRKLMLGNDEEEEIMIFSKTMESATISQQVIAKITIAKLGNRTLKL
jgi:predicted DNA-binding WGR domain protein